MTSDKVEVGVSRRTVLAGAAANALVCGLPPTSRADVSSPFRLRYLLSSCLYGYADVRQILPEVSKTGASAIDIWPRVHGNQREQIDAMGVEAFRDLLVQFHVKLGCITQYPLGPFQLGEEIRLAERLGCSTIVTGARGPAGLKGVDLKAAVKTFLRQMVPHIRVAEQHGVVVAIENHGNSLIESIDSIRWFADCRPSKHLAVALAPYHLPQNPQLIAQLISELADRLQVFYAWQYGKGCKVKLPKADELLQLPGRGTLDFAPLLAALRQVNFSGWTSIFMHPVPRGIPIHTTTDEVTAEINRARRFLESQRG